MPGKGGGVKQLYNGGPKRRPSPSQRKKKGIREKKQEIQQEILPKAGEGWGWGSEKKKKA